MPPMRAERATEFMTELLAVWTEPDPAIRRAAIEAHYQDDIVFYDPDGVFTGHADLESFSDSLQQRFPGQHFEMVGEPSVVGNALRTYWRFGPVSGMDLALIADDKVSTLYAFVERPA
jgi:SnoaL-like domain